MAICENSMALNVVQDFEESALCSVAAGTNLQGVVSCLKSAYVLNRHDKYWVRCSSNCLCQLKVTGWWGRYWLAADIILSLLPHNSVGAWTLTWNNTAIQCDYQAALKAGCCSVSHRPGYNTALRKHSAVCNRSNTPNSVWEKVHSVCFS